MSTPSLPASTSFLGYPARPTSPTSIIPSGSTTPFMFISAPSPAAPSEAPDSRRTKKVTSNDRTAPIPGPSSFNRTSEVLRSPLNATEAAWSSAQLGPFSNFFVGSGSHDKVRNSSLDAPATPSREDSSSSTAQPEPRTPQQTGPSEPTNLATPGASKIHMPVPDKPSLSILRGVEPQATSTPWRPSSKNKQSSPSPPSSSDMRQAAKEAVDPVHLRDLLDNAGLFFAHLHRPEEAQHIYRSLSAPDTLDRYGFLFYESNYVVNEELETDDIHNSKIVEDKEFCYSLLVKHQHCTEYVVEGLEVLVNAMLRLESVTRRWKSDHADVLMSVLHRSSSRGMVSDAHRTLQYRKAKALTLIHQRQALHCGHSYPTSVKLTASDFSMELTMSKTKREMLDKWLKKPDVFPNLTPEYQEVVLRRIQAAQNDEETPPLPHIVFEQHFKILPNSLLVDPIVFEQELTQGILYTTDEPTMRTEAPVLTPFPLSNVDSRPRYTNRSSFGNPGFGLPPAQDEPARHVQFQDPPPKSQPQYSQSCPTAPPINERQSSGPWNRVDSNALPDFGAAQTVRDTVFPQGQPLSSMHPQPVWRMESLYPGSQGAQHDLPLHMPQTTLSASQAPSNAAKGANGDYIYHYNVPPTASFHSAPPTRYAASGGKVPPSMQFPSQTDPLKYPEDPPGNYGRGPPYGPPRGNGGGPSSGSGNSGGGGGGGGGVEVEVVVEKEMETLLVRHVQPAGGGPPGGDPPPPGSYAYGHLPNSQTAIIIHHSPVPRKQGVRLDQKILRNSVPQWDGDLKTILTYLHKMNNLAMKNIHIVARETQVNEIAVVMQNVPPTWSTVLSLDTISTIPALLAKVSDKKDKLIVFASMAPANLSQYKQVLKLPAAKKETRSFRGGFEFNVDNNGALTSPPAGIVASEGFTPTGQAENTATEAHAATVQNQKSSSNRPHSTGPKPPRAGPRFPRNDLVKSKRAPPGDCRVCGSPFHWDWDCPHWNNNFNNVRLSNTLWADIRRSEGEYLKGTISQHCYEPKPSASYSDSLLHDHPSILEDARPDGVPEAKLEDMLAEVLAVDGSTHHLYGREAFAGTKSAAGEMFTPADSTAMLAGLPPSRK
ncbi:uncharacterized protein B0H18DRAFT_963594 [Fomitopsis serialis]|uniref:uncharacterized protein n=1 Tax=Fomitopsis serialis TaxID=139415 RepID=UPI002007A27B|nr:uncharacterized protein B0H18DRAFT_963594 [Neoantrodia serialis]KAH9910243.1 hypothetical protein B0H18DRAFT_963594 [Neoantrodia serialis]